MNVVEMQPATQSQETHWHTCTVQVPYVGLLNRSATRHPPVFCGEAQWLMDLGRFLDLPREEQEGSDPRVKSIRKAIGPAYIDRPEKLLLRLCTVGYSVCAAR